MASWSFWSSGSSSIVIGPAPVPYIRFIHEEWSLLLYSSFACQHVCKLFWIFTSPVYFSLFYVLIYYKVWLSKKHSWKNLIGLVSYELANWVEPRVWDVPHPTTIPTHAVKFQITLTSTTRKKWGQLVFIYFNLCRVTGPTQRGGLPSSTQLVFYLFQFKHVTSLDVGGLESVAEIMVRTSYSERIQIKSLWICSMLFWGCGI